MKRPRPHAGTTNRTSMTTTTPNRIRRYKYGGVLGLLAASLIVDPSQFLVQAQVPGLVHTESGYDNIVGDDAICWSAQRYQPEGSLSQELRKANFEGKHWKNSLVPEFIAGATNMMASCPSGTALKLDLRSTPSHGSDKLRTHQYYTFHLELDVDSDAMRQDMDLHSDAFFYSHKAQDGKTGFDFPQIALQLDFCPINGNLCTPFMFEGLETSNTNGGGGLTQLQVGNLQNQNEDINSQDTKGKGPHNFDQHGDVITYQETSAASPNHSHRQLQQQSSTLFQTLRKLLTTFVIITPEEEEDLEYLQAMQQNKTDIASEEQDMNNAPPPPPPLLVENDTTTSTTTTTTSNTNDHASMMSIKGAAASPEFFIEIDRAKYHNQSTFQVHYDIEIQVQDEGEYLPMATVMFFLTNQTQFRRAMPHEYPIYKVDIASLLHDRSVHFYQPIEINQISTAAAVTSYILIGTCALVQLFFLVSTIQHRNNNVMQLSQVGFLIALQVAALVAIVASVFFQPKNNVWCYLGGPLTVIPLQLIFAIIFGRLRRIYSIMAPLLSFHSTTGANKNHLKRGLRVWKTVMMMGSASSSANSEHHSKPSSTEGETTQEGAPSPGQQKGTGFLKKLQCWKCGSFEPRGSLRQQFSQTQLLILVTLVTLPMVVWEVCLLIFFPPELQLVLNEDESVGRYECGTEATQTYQLASTGILFVTICMDLYQVQSSKSLPAFFNETTAVSNGLAVALFITAVGFGVLIVSDGPEGEPDLTYLMEVLIVLCTALNLSIRLTLPKLQLIWRGEKVVVSRLLRDHRQSEEAKTKRQDSGPQISGLENSMASSYTSSAVAIRRMEEGSESTANGEVDSSYMHNSHGYSGSSRQHQSNTTQGVAGLPSIDEGKSMSVKSPALRKRISIHPGEAPPSKLTMQLLSHTNHAQHINKKVLAGYQVEKSDWKKLVESVEEFQALLQGYDFEEAKTDPMSS